MGPELLIIGAGLQAAQGFMAYQQGNAQAKAATQMASYNAQVVQQQADVKRMQEQRKQRLLASTAKVRGAGTGASLSSFEDVFESNKQQGLLDLAMIDYDSRLNQSQIIYDGKVQASNAKSAGVSGLISGLSGAAVTGSQAWGAMGGGKAVAYNPATGSAGASKSFFPQSGETVTWR